MSTYHPDRWVILELTSKHGTHHRVFATWGGSYLEGQSWKMSSGVEGCSIDDEGNYESPQTSGSTYILHPQAYGMCGYGAGVLTRYQEDADASNGELSIKLLTEEESIAYLESLIKG